MKGFKCMTAQKKTYSEKPIRIIYADDDEDDRIFFKEALANSKKNFKLLTVADGEKLLRLIQLNSNLPDILFLDVNMPKINGLECLEQIRKNNAFDNIPVVIISTCSYPIDDMISKGANLFICKSSFFEDLSNILIKLFSSNWKEMLLSSDGNIYKLINH